MTALDNRNELIAAIVERFRLGEIGPLTLKNELRKLRVSDDDIQYYHALHVDECARNLRAGFKNPR